MVDLFTRRTEMTQEKSILVLTSRSNCACKLAWACYDSPGKLLQWVPRLVLIFRPRSYRAVDRSQIGSIYRRERYCEAKERSGRCFLAKDEISSCTGSSCNI